MGSNINKSSSPRDGAEIFTIVLTGDNATGKSCLMERFCSGKFKLLNFTVGFNYGTRTIILDNKKIQLNIFDTAGHERFYESYRLVYYKADGIVMVYDTTRKETLPSLENRWIKEIRENVKSDDVPIIIVGSKSDLANERVVQRSEVEQIRADIPEIKNAVKSSAKTNENVEFIFTWLATEIKRRKYQKANASATNNSANEQTLRTS